MTEKRAPVQGYTPGIPWEMHLRAYDAYRAKWGEQKALIDLEGRNCRGGFSVGELDMFIPGWRDELSERTVLLKKIADLEAERDTAQPSTVTAESRGAFFRHKERGTVYEVLGSALVQMSADIDIADDEEVTVYRGEDGRLWVRPAPEFYDGRFEEIAPPATSPVTPEPKSVKRTMTINLTDEEMAALEEIAAAKDLEPPKVFRAMLKTEQLVVRGLATVSIEGGPLSASPVTGALVEAAKAVDAERLNIKMCVKHSTPEWLEKISAALDGLRAALAAQKAEG